MHRWHRGMLYIYLAVGGVAGTFARYGLSGWVYSVAGQSFPWGTFVVNLVGSFLLGALATALQVVSVSPEVRISLTVGFCGAFTTFSTFSYETAMLMHQGAWGRAGAYAFGSLLLGLVALWAGIALATAALRLGG